MLIKRKEGFTILTREVISKSIENQLGYLAYSLENRGKLSLFDLHKYCEDFSAHLLNRVYGYNLVNLNEKNFNEPGIDLGDIDNKVAFQVTTNKTSRKVNETLEKITDEQKEVYEMFFVLIVGKKQRSYTLDPLATEMNFTEDNILDIRDLMIRINSLSIDRMKTVDDFLKKEVYKVYLVIEGVNEPVLLSDSPTLIFPNCKALVHHYETTLHPLDISEKEEMEMEEGIRDLMNTLISLPPATREFFYSLVIKAKHKNEFDAICIGYEKMKRFVILSEQEYIEELKILKDENLIKFDEDFEDNLFIVLSGLCSKNYALNNILELVGAKNLNLEDVLLKFNLSAFATE